MTEGSRLIRVDSHAHLEMEQFESDREQMIARAREAGVESIVAIGSGTGPGSLDCGIQLAEKYELIYATIGIHPHEAKLATDADFQELGQLARRPKVTAWGEIGLVYLYDHSPRDVKKQVFLKQLELAGASGRRNNRGRFLPRQSPWAFLRADRVPENPHRLPASLHGDEYRWWRKLIRTSQLTEFRNRASQDRCRCRSRRLIQRQLRGPAQSSAHGQSRTVPFRGERGNLRESVGCPQSSAVSETHAAKVALGGGLFQPCPHRHIFQKAAQNRLSTLRRGSNNHSV